MLQKKDLLQSIKPKEENHEGPTTQLQAHHVRGGQEQVADIARLMDGGWQLDSSDTSIEVLNARRCRPISPYKPGSIWSQHTSHCSS